MPDDKPNANPPETLSPGRSAGAAAPAIAGGKPAAAGSARENAEIAVVEEPKLAPSTRRGKTMEIHAPDKPIHSKKEFAFHMFTVILGILIALGFESIVEWAHHRALVHEARANISREIAANKKAIALYQEEIPKLQADLNRIVSVMQEIERTGKFSEKELLYHYDIHSFDSAAWHTAGLSGAVTYMDYDEVQRYTDAYDVQQELQLLEHENLKDLFDLGSRLTILNKDIKKVPVQRFEEIEQVANRDLVLIGAMETLCKATDQAYAKALIQR